MTYGRMTTEEMHKFFAGLIEHLEEDEILTRDMFKGDGSGSYALYTATYLLDDGLLRGEYYDDYMAYAKASYLAATYAIMPSGKVIKK